MTLRIVTSDVLHHAGNGYNCGRRGCPCQSAGITDPTIERFHTYALKPGSTDCAWCRDEQGIPQGNGSHGICKRHSDELRARAKERKRR